MTSSKMLGLQYDYPGEIIALYFINTQDVDLKTKEILVNKGINKQLSFMKKFKNKQNQGIVPLQNVKHTIHYRRETVKVHQICS